MSVTGFSPFTATLERLTGQVCRLSRRESDEFLRLYADAHPFVLTEEMSGWRFFQKLSKMTSVESKFSCFSDAAPNLPVQYSRLRGSNRSFTFDASTRQRFRMYQAPLGSFVSSALRAGATTWYMQAQPIPQVTNAIPELNRLHNSMCTPLFWMGNSGQRTSLHNDRFRNFIVMFVGCKRVYLYPPGEFTNLYLAPIDRRVQGALTCMADPSTPDYEKFPLLARADRNLYAVDLREGEILYIPPLWWHLVSADGPSISANLWTDEIEAAESLYLPQCLDLVDSPVPTLPVDVRVYLSGCFRSVITQNALGDGAEHAQGTVAEVVLQAARQESTRLDAIPDGSVRHRWAYWLTQLMDQFVFQRNGDPYPTMKYGEFGRMVSRLRN